MESDRNKLLMELNSVVSASGDRRAVLEKVAAILRRSGNYRWVGLYDVDRAPISSSLLADFKSLEEFREKKSLRATPTNYQQTAAWRFAYFSYYFLWKRTDPVDDGSNRDGIGGSHGSVRTRRDEKALAIGGNRVTAQRRRRLRQ